MQDVVNRRLGRGEDPESKKVVSYVSHPTLEYEIQLGHMATHGTYKCPGRVLPDELQEKAPTQAPTIL